MKMLEGTRDMRFLWLLAPLALTACPSAGTVQTANLAAIAACNTDSAAISVLSDLRTAGKLTAAQIALVDKDIAVMDPICSSPSDAPALTAIETAAAAELKALAGVQ